MIDPKVCRENAMRCAELANASTDLGAQSSLFDMAAKWPEVAANLEQLDCMSSHEGSVGQMTKSDGAARSE
jgi:hypothetical protein